MNYVNLLKKSYGFINRPVLSKNWLSDFILFIPRFVCGYLLTSSFGADKFGMPWTAADRNLDFFEVIYWFPEDVANFGGLFEMFPEFFAWMGAFSEAVGGLLLALGFNTRVAAFLIVCTMLTAMFFQKWNQGVWGMLPAMGFLWVGIYHLINGSGRFGIDYLINKKL